MGLLSVLAGGAGHVGAPQQVVQDEGGRHPDDLRRQVRPDRRPPAGQQRSDHAVPPAMYSTTTKRTRLQITIWVRVCLGRSEVTWMSSPIGASPSPAWK